jgi:hypothetical protein
MGHEPLAATEVPQLLDKTNGPLTVTLLMLTAEVPLLESVKVCHAVPVPTGVLPKLKLDGLRVTAACADSETAIKAQSREKRFKARFILQLLKLRFRGHVPGRSAAVKGLGD